MMKNELAKQEIDESFLPPALHFNSITDLFPKGASDSYELKTRLSTKQLLRIYVSSISRSQAKYVEEINKARSILSNNIEACLEMDSQLGDGDFEETDDSSDDALETLPDGSKRFTCPILHCKKKTFRLPRHIDSAHPNLSSFQKNKCHEFAKVVANNKKNTISAAKTSTTQKRQKSSQQPPTCLVNRKNNLKKCSICCRLVMNISQHIAKVHKVDRKESRFAHLIAKSETILKCYTKIENGKTVQLSGKELEDAKSKFESSVSEQSHTLNDLKKLREEIINYKKKIEEADNETKIELKELLAISEDKYKRIRYKDNRIYTPNVAKWKDAFMQHLIQREHSYPLRAMHMAIDVMLPYESKTGISLSFGDLTNGSKLRSLLQEFKKCENTSVSSKIKYLKMFTLFLQFILCDFSSPERGENDSPSEILSRGVKLKDIEHEIQIVCSALSKHQGRERVETRKRVAKKLIGEEEMDDLMEETSNSLWPILEKSEEDLMKLTTKEILDIRNSLMAVAALRLGRRSQELVKMTLKEVEEAEEKTVDDKHFYIVKVLEQKDLKMGKEAAIAFEDKDFKVLKIFIQKLRPVILKDNPSPYVFVSSRADCINEDLSLAAAWKILQKFQTSSGKKLTCRSVRRSRITNSRNLNLSYQEQSDMAASMNHSVQTAERYYNYKKITDSVASSLAAKSRKNLSCEGSKSFEDFSKGEDSFSFNESSLHKAGSSTPKKPEKRVLSESSSQESSQESSEDKNMDETIRTLRNKKIKFSFPKKVTREKSIK